MSQENPELSGIIMEINDLRGFIRPIVLKQRNSGATARKAGRSRVVLHPLPLSVGNSGRGLPPLAFHGRIEAFAAFAFAGRLSNFHFLFSNPPLPIPKNKRVSAPQ
jgi:hypothetical protein